MKNSDTPAKYVQTSTTYYHRFLDVNIQTFSLSFSQPSAIILQHKSFYSIYTLQMIIKSKTPFVEVISTTIMFIFKISFFHNFMKFPPFCRIFEVDFLKYVF